MSVFTKADREPGLIVKSLSPRLLKLLICAFAFVFGNGQVKAATPANEGQSGYINMPNASVEADGTLAYGYSYDKPYGALWMSSTILPFLQVTGRYVSISGIPGFSSPDGYGSNYGRYKDKVVDAKARLVKESAWFPELAIGATDLQGTQLFQGKYIVATKRFGAQKNIEASIGRGSDRPDGIFGGVRWTPESLPNWSLVAEYDANNYSKDFRAEKTFASQREKGPAVGIEYRWGWLGIQAARHQNYSSVNAFISIPLHVQEYVPKITEPPYYQGESLHITVEDWHKSPIYAANLVNALAEEDFKNIRAEIRGYTLYLTLTNARISNLGRAVGRATRVALAFAPQDVREIHVTYTTLEQPIATYEFFDLEKLNQYLGGKISRADFLKTVLVRYAKPEDKITVDQEYMLAGVSDKTRLKVLSGQDGDIVQARLEDREASRFKIAPRIGFFFNDPSGAFRYDLMAASDYNKRLGDGLYLDGSAALDLVDTVSGVTQPSNSLLPHVRTDVAEYKRNGSRLKLYRLLLNKYAMLDEGWYARGTAGIYEEMFRGAGGQILYLPHDSRWAADLSVDALQQRDFKGWFGGRDYRTITAIGSLHYRLPYGITLTARAGKFLAKDTGVRGEFKRRFRSGIEVGAWYTRTNGKDITSPGTPSSPYHDKGIFISIPLSSMLTSDSQAIGGFAISPWTRDVGQMVDSPGDLYDIVENPRRDFHTFDGLGNFAERPDEQALPAVNPPEETFGNPMPEVRSRLKDSYSALPDTSDFAKDVGIAAGVIAISAIGDKAIDNFAKNHAGSAGSRGLDRFGKALPVVMIGGAAMSVAFGDDVARNTGLISLQSALAAAGESFGAKYIVDRARPEEGRGSWTRATTRSESSFPSNHASVAFAAVTPFAKEYDMPWLYGLAAAGSMGRVAARKHWFSDTVAGGLLGYATGSLLWQAQHENRHLSLSFRDGFKDFSIAWDKKF